MFFFDFNRDAKRRMFGWRITKTGRTSSLAYDLSVNDRYADNRNARNETSAERRDRCSSEWRQIFLRGNSASPQGDRPFFRRMNLKP
jgi:hypothetical protein